MKPPLYHLILLLLFFSCQETEKTNIPAHLQYDIIHYGQETEKLIAGAARDVELEGRRRDDVKRLRVLDSCLFLRKQLVTIGYDDSLHILTTEPSDYQAYVSHLRSLSDPDNEELQTIWQESRLSDTVSEVGLAYISDLMRLEYIVCRQLVMRVLPAYDGFGNRVYAMTEKLAFSEGQSINILLISDFATRNTASIAMDFSVDSILINDEKADIIESLKTIDRIGHLVIRTPKTGTYRIYGKTKQTYPNSQSPLPMEDYPFTAVVEVE